MNALQTDDDFLSLARMLRSCRGLFLCIDTDHDRFIGACEKRLLEETDDIPKEEFKSFDDTDNDYEYNISPVSNIEQTHATAFQVQHRVG